ncbi:MAG: sigma-54-dependent Fis family transcriptional regulator [SAR324 cluster bacterium]|nr:sigma-54-dependent Fis family transcriptional regulator [SAR324 cluster bacterium]
MNILLIDDQPQMGEMFSRLIRALKHQITYISSGVEALKLTDEQFDNFDLLFIDMSMPELDGCETGLAIKERIPDIVTIMLTADSRIETVIKALRDSKFDDYLCKSDVMVREAFDSSFDVFSSSFKLTETLMRAQSLINARQELRNTQSALTNAYQLSHVLRKQSLDAHKELIGDSTEMQRVLQLVQKVAPMDTTVLIQGETGTGKELIAREIHKQSPRAQNPFVPVNCGAIPRELLESELFGHKKGSFTGASSDREGLFQLANEGTLFLDEIGDMPIDLQVKLLRVLQEQEVLPVGEVRPVKVDVRIVSATHQDLRRNIEEKTFREDLFYRLNVFPIPIPPLRDRIADLSLMVQHFIAKKAKYTQVRGIAPEALHVLEARPWKGNVRELENVVERAILMSSNEFLSPADFLDSPSLHEAPSAASAAASPGQENSGSPRGYEKLWDCFLKNNCKLWIIEDPESVRQEMEILLKGAVYQKKGHFGQLLVQEKKQLKIDLRYLNPFANDFESHTILFEFLGKSGEKPAQKDEDRNSQNVTGMQRAVSTQLVLKGLPDTYIFDILYPPAKRNELSLLSQQQLIRTIILRYAQTFATAKNLKGVFEEVMMFLIDETMKTLVAGLDKDGLEAVRACLCSKSHIFPGIASQLKVNPVQIEKEIKKVFPNYINPN